MSKAIKTAHKLQKKLINHLPPRRQPLWLPLNPPHYIHVHGASKATITSGGLGKGGALGADAPSPIAFWLHFKEVMNIINLQIFASMAARGPPSQVLNLPLITPLTTCSSPARTKAIRRVDRKIADWTNVLTDTLRMSQNSRTYIVWCNIATSVWYNVRLLFFVCMIWWWMWYKKHAYFILASPNQLLLNYNPYWHISFPGSTICYILLGVWVILLAQTDCL